MNRLLYVFPRLAGAHGLAVLALFACTRPQVRVAVAESALASGRGPLSRQVLVLKVDGPLHGLFLLPSLLDLLGGSSHSASGQDLAFVVQNFSSRCSVPRVRVLRLYDCSLDGLVDELHLGFSLRVLVDFRLLGALFQILASAV